MTRRKLKRRIQLERERLARIATDAGIAGVFHIEERATSVLEQLDAMVEELSQSNNQEHPRGTGDTP